MSPASLLRDAKDVLIEVRWQLRSRRRALLAWAAALITVAGVYIPFYPALGGPELQSLVDALPADLSSALGYDRIGTPAGYLTSTVFGLLGPVLLLAMGIGIGARTVAGEEEAGELELAAAAPVRRDVLLAGRIIAVHAQVFALALVTFAASALLVTLVGMDVAITGIAAAALGLNLLVIAFATIALSVGAITGRRGVAVAVGAGTAVAAFVADAIAGMLADGAVLAALSPFSWYLGSDPIANGVPIVDFALLGALTFVAWGAALLRFPRRDLGV